MEFKNYKTLSPNVKEQIRKVTETWLKCMGESVVGIYIHGSIVLNCFVEGVSDIDILIICDRQISRDERLQISRDIMEIDAKPSPLEMSAIWINDLNPWKYPTPCQFHYSDAWTERLKKLLSCDIKECFIVDEDSQHFYRKLGYKDCGCLVLNIPGFEQPLEMFMAKAL